MIDFWKELKARNLKSINDILKCENFEQKQKIFLEQGVYPEVTPLGFILLENIGFNLTAEDVIKVAEKTDLSQKDLGDNTYLDLALFAANYSIVDIPYINDKLIYFLAKNVNLSNKTLNDLFKYQKKFTKTKNIVSANKMYHILNKVSLNSYLAEDYETIMNLVFLSPVYHLPDGMYDFFLKKWFNKKLRILDVISSKILAQENFSRIFIYLNNVSKSDLNKNNILGFSLLSMAVIAKNNNNISKLIKAGVSPFIKNKDGTNAFELAQRIDYKDELKQLVKYSKLFE